MEIKKLQCTQWSKATLLKIFSVALLSLAAVLLVTPKAYAQGCIVARSTQQVFSPDGLGIDADSSKWELTVSYRHQFSFRHFVGSVEQVHRIQEHSEVENRENLQNFQLTYYATPRWSFEINVPLLFASRHGTGSIYTLHSEGIGDTVITARTWLWNPTKPHKQNIAIGFGVLMPTGKDNVVNNVIVTAGQPPVNKIVDYSVQPGGGGWGSVFEWQIYRLLDKKSAVYFNGNYIAPFKSTNGVIRNPANTDPLTRDTAISDMYLGEIGFTRTLYKGERQGVDVSFGPRVEGVPAHNLYSHTNLGFRRPGLAVSMEPGIRYSWGSKFSLNANIGRAIYRARVKSVPDILEHKHGDAAFADWVWLASLTRRF